MGDHATVLGGLRGGAGRGTGRGRGCYSEWPERGSQEGEGKGEAGEEGEGQAGKHHSMPQRTGMLKGSLSELAC